MNKTTDKTYGWMAHRDHASAGMGRAMPMFVFIIVITALAYGVLVLSSHAL